MKISNDQVIGGVWFCAAVATFHGGAYAAFKSDVPVGISVLYPVMLDGLAIAALRKIRAGQRLWVAWPVMLLTAGGSGWAQAYVLADGKDGGAATLAAGMGAAPAIIVLLATLLGGHDRAHEPVVEEAHEPLASPDDEPDLEAHEPDVSPFSEPPGPDRMSRDDWDRALDELTSTRTPPAPREPSRPAERRGSRATKTSPTKRAHKRADGLTCSTSEPLSKATLTRHRAAEAAGEPCPARRK